jgi:hypothetical protein
MKPLYKIFTLTTAIVVLSISLSSYKSNSKRNAASYVINLLSIDRVNGNDVWTWSVSNPSPGNGENGTLQDISHWSLPLCPNAESAVVSAAYSTNGVNWISVAPTMDRDPSIRTCTTNDVLKFDFGTSGTTPTYYRITFNKYFTVDPMAVSYIKTGGGLQGCNLYYYSGIGCTELIGGTRND